MYRYRLATFTHTLRMCLLTLAVSLGAAAALAQDTYPSKPVRVVAPFPAGQGTELIARQLAQQLSEVMGQNFFVDARAGAAGVIGTNFVKSSEPDGYTLLVAGAGPLAINPVLRKDIPYDTLRDFRPVQMIATVPNVLVVRPDFPATDLAGVIAHIKANPGKLNYASSGSGVPNHLIMELFKSAAGLDIVHVPHQGAAVAMTALLGGDVHVMFETAAAVMPMVKAGRLKVIATASGKRALALPDVPTIAESGFPGFSAQGWSALVAPAATPDAVISRLSAATVSIVKTKAFRDRLISLGADPVDMDLPATEAFMKAELASWKKAVEISGARVE